MVEADLKVVTEFLKSKKIDVLNTRVFKNGDKHFLITVGSVLSDHSFKNAEF